MMQRAAYQHGPTLLFGGVEAVDLECNRHGRAVDHVAGPGTDRNPTGTGGLDQLEVDREDNRKVLFDDRDTPDLLTPKQRQTSFEWEFFKAGIRHFRGPFVVHAIAHYDHRSATSHVITGPNVPCTPSTLALRTAFTLLGWITNIPLGGSRSLPSSWCSRAS